MESIFITVHAALSVVCWFITAVAATVAVFSKRINDTVTERIGLAAIAIGCTGTGCRIIKAGWISDGGLFLSAALAFYVCAVFWKHWKNVPGSSADKKGGEA
jgi:hypothetical protein